MGGTTPCANSSKYLTIFWTSFCTIYCNQDYFVKLWQFYVLLFNPNRINVWKSSKLYCLLLKKGPQNMEYMGNKFFLKDSFPNNAIIDGGLIPIFTLNYHLFALSRSLSLSENFFDVKHLPSKKKCDSLLFLRLCKYCPLRVLKTVTSSSSN